MAMFVHNLSAQQQSDLLAASEILISSDGDISLEEKKMLEILASQCDEDVQATSDFSVSNLQGKFFSKAEKSSFLLELLAVAHSDGEYHALEKNLILEIANSIEIDSGTLNEMEDWVKAQLELAHISAKFMED